MYHIHVSNLYFLLLTPFQQLSQILIRFEIFCVTFTQHLVMGSLVKMLFHCEILFANTLFIIQFVITVNIDTIIAAESI